jgi:hypothetical protein
MLLRSLLLAASLAAGIALPAYASSLQFYDPLGGLHTQAPCLPYHLAGGTAASTNPTSVTTKPTQLCTLALINTTTTLYYLKVYDLATAPTCSSATGIKHVYPIPPASGSGGAGGLVAPKALFGEWYSLGFAYCVTGGGADTDNTNAAAGIYIEGSYQ